MIFGVIGIIFTIISIFILIHSYKYKNNIKQINIDIENHNKSLEIQNNNLILKEKEIQSNIEHQINTLNEINKTIENNLNNQKSTSRKAFENYCDLLDIEYQNKEKEYNLLCNNLQNAYAQKQDKLLKEIEKTSKKLEDIKSVRAAAIAAQIREKEIKEKASFYCLKIKEADLSDIKVLEKIKGQLNNPRILSMLIWQTYWQKPMTALCNNILGTSVKCGIYKITNQITDECYIGQAVDIATRWKTHAKCGLGIDTPINNKLYKAIQEYGIWNFSWELLEECSRNDLDSKEKFYIELYQSKDFGYNTLKGIN